ncbi:hypothetical protein ACHAW5_003022 [Stephanodiscus triporus]|uniref:Uncharacterized protein n=1 Tax=Stephanodiscus triporus TaxID=2934178 RepID=A0ABD3N295_9STRA
MFETALADLVTGIPVHKDTALFISQSISGHQGRTTILGLLPKERPTEIDLPPDDGLQHVLGCLCGRGGHKLPALRSSAWGYWGICQGLDLPDRSPVVLLTMNLLKKELCGHH